MAPAAPATASTATNPGARPAVTTEARAGRCRAVRTPVMDGHDLDVLVVPASVGFLVFDPQIGEMDLLVEVRQRPCFNLARVAIGVSVVVVPVPIALVQPLLVLALELVVQ